MRVYQHRINSLHALEQVPSDLGIELDLRSERDRIVVTHDPFTDGPALDEHFARIGPRPCIFNVKCEGIEERVLAAAREHGVSDFFFLDLSIPAAMKLVRAGEKRLAVRWSEVEPIEAVLAWEGRASWVWVDCFTRYPGSLEDWERVGRSFRICLVSPELQKHDEETQRRLRAELAGRRFDAVCTKQPASWPRQG
jgi:hypothetical protein